MLRKLAVTSMLVACLGGGVAAIAQDGDRTSRGGNDSNRGQDRQGRYQRWQRDFDVERYLKQLDVDKNGTIESSELGSGRTQRFLSRIGVDVEKPIVIESAVKQINSAAAKRKDEQREKFAAEVGPKLNGFGVERSAEGVASFGETEKPEPSIASFSERVTGLKRSDFDAKTIEKAREILDGYDRDKSGFLEGDEISRVRWRPPQPAQSDLNSDGRISLLEMAKRLQEKSDSDKEGSAKNSAGNRQAASGKVSPNSAAGGTSASRPSELNLANGESRNRISTGRTGGNSFVKYVDGLFGKYDTNKDQKLSQDELKKMRRPFKGDTNKDGFISKKEAIDSIQGRSKDKKSSNADRPSRRSQSNESAAGNSDQKASAKASQGREEKRRGSLGGLDANADGQIQMAEFSARWDEETLQRFRTTDRDGNGIISAAEWDESQK